MSHQLAEAWRSAPRRASPTRSAATPEEPSPQKTMNLYHRNVPWLFGEQGQSLGRTRASPAALTRRWRSLTRKWTINRTMRWVSRAHVFFLSELWKAYLFAAHAFIAFQRGEKSLCGERAAVGWIMGWRWRRGPLIGGRRVREAIGWGRYLERRFAAASPLDQRRESSPHERKNSASRLSGCWSPGPSPQEAEEFDKVSPTGERLVKDSFVWDYAWKFFSGWLDRHNGWLNGYNGLKCKFDRAGNLRWKDGGFLLKRANLCSAERRQWAEHCCKPAVLLYAPLFILPRLPERPVCSLVKNDSLVFCFCF